MAIWSQLAIVSHGATWLLKAMLCRKYGVFCGSGFEEKCWLVDQSTQTHTHTHTCMAQTNKHSSP